MSPPAVLVGVDSLFTRRGRQWCHLVCDDFSPAGLEALHRVAEQLGLQRAYLHDPPGKLRPHYDLTPALRQRALQLGLPELSRRELVACLRRGREKAGRTPAP